MEELEARIKHLLFLRQKQINLQNEFLEEASITEQWADKAHYIVLAQGPSKAAANLAHKLEETQKELREQTLIKCNKIAAEQSRAEQCERDQEKLMRLIVRNTRTLTLECKYELANTLEKKERALEFLEGTNTVRHIIIAQKSTPSCGMFCCSPHPAMTFFSAEENVVTELGQANEDVVIREAIAEEASQEDQQLTRVTIDSQPILATVPRHEGTEAPCTTDS
jgi:chaperonin GroEL (HSP60 family)